MPRPYTTATPTADETPEQGITHTESGGTVVTGAAAMVAYAKGAGRVAGGAS